MSESEKPLSGLALAAEKARQRARDADTGSEAVFASESALPQEKQDTSQPIYFRASHSTTVIIDQHGKKHQFSNGFLPVTDPEFAQYIRDNYMSKQNSKVSIAEASETQYDESKELKGTDVIISPIPDQGQKDLFKPAPRPEGL